MPVMSEDSRVGAPLVTTREPKGPIRGGDKGSVGDQALRDAIVIIALCWVFVFFLAFSLRGSNI